MEWNAPHDCEGVRDVCSGLLKTLRMGELTTLFTVPDALLNELGMLDLAYMEDSAVWTMTVADTTAAPELVHSTRNRKRLQAHLHAAGVPGMRNPACPWPFIRDGMHGIG